MESNSRAPPIEVIRPVWWWWWRHTNHSASVPHHCCLAGNKSYCSAWWQNYASLTTAVCAVSHGFQCTQSIVFPAHISAPRGHDIM